MRQTSLAAASRHAPAFQIDIAPQPRLQGLVAVLALLAAGSVIAGVSLHLPGLGASALLLLPLAGVAGWRLARVEPRRLRWDGQCWQLGAASGEEHAVEIELLFDLDDWLLLRARGSPGWRGHYLPLSKDRSGPAWGALRATLQAARPVARPVP